MEPAYLPPKKRNVGYVTPEYNNPHPRRHHIRRDGKKERVRAPRTFRRSYFSPWPKSNAAVLAHHRKLKAKPGLPLKPVYETYQGHTTHMKGWVEPKFDDKLLKWRPKRAKRTMSPAPLIVFSEIHMTTAVTDAAADAAAEAEAQALEADPKRRSRKPRDRPTTKLTFKPIIVKKGRGKFFPRHYRMPAFAGHSIESGLSVFKSLNKNVIAEVQPPSYFRPRKGAKPADPFAHRFAAADVDTVEGEDLTHDVAEALPTVPTETDLPALQLESPNSILAQESTLAQEVESNPDALEAVETFFSEVKGLLRK